MIPSWLQWEWETQHQPLFSQQGGWKNQLLILDITWNHWLIRRRRANNGIRQLLSPVLFNSTDKGLHISPFLVRLWTKEPFFFFLGGWSHYLMCECSSLEVEAKPPRREQLWTNTVQAHIHCQFFFSSSSSSLLHRSIPLSADEKKKKLEHLKMPRRRKSKYRCYCTSSPRNGIFRKVNLKK